MRPCFLSVFEPHFRGHDEAVFGCKKSIHYQMSQHEQQVTSNSTKYNNFQTLHQKAIPNETYTLVTRSNWEKVNVKRDPTLKIGCTLWERGSRVGMTGVFYSRDARLSISSSPMIVWARNLFSCILQATSSKLLWYQAIFIVGIIHSHMPILCAQSLSLPSSKFKMPMLCTQSLRLPSSKFKGPILSTQSLRLPSSKSRRPNTLHSITAPAVLQV